MCLNVVIYKVEGVLKLIDFGLAKKLSDVEDTLRSVGSHQTGGDIPRDGLRMREWLYTASSRD